MRKMVRNSNGEHMPHFVMSSLACVHVYVAHSLAMEQCISLCFILLMELILVILLLASGEY